MLPRSTTLPRPRPPAQLRRSAGPGANGHGDPPPPPYASSFSKSTSTGERRRTDSFDTLLGSPVRATMKIFSWEDSAGQTDAASQEEDLDWLNEKSRNELSELLLRADSLIKKRESDLDHSLEVCKNLFDENKSLQGKHKQLLSRIPSTPSRSLVSSPVTSPAPVVPSVLHSTSSYFDDLSPSTSASASPSTFPFQSKPRHFRKISVSPDDISALADQNAELLGKLENLESEAAQSDIAGRRVLKQLEREISLLKGELDLTHAKNAELEEQAKESQEAHSRHIAEAIMTRKETREMKLSGSMSGVVDFAPGSTLVSMDSAPEVSSPRDTPVPRSPSLPTPGKNASTLASPLPSRMRTTSGSEPQLAAISQLLAKIQELEDANARIVQQQVETSARLQAMQHETASMSRMYERLADMGDVVIELVDEDESPPVNAAERGERHGENTIRFRSFRRRLESDGDASRSFIRESTPRSEAESFSQMHLSTGRKPRKSVMGLFGAPEHPESPSPTSRHGQLMSVPVPFPQGLTSGSGSGSPSSPSSPTFCPLSLAPMMANPGSQPTSLGSELGSEYGDDWAVNAGHYHLRTTSLYDMSSLQLPMTPSPKSPKPPPAHLLFSLDSSDAGAGGNPSSSEDVAGTPPKKRTISKTNAPHLTLEPPTPEKNTLVSKQSLRYRKMSQTVRGRTQRWLDGRFQDSMMGLKSEAESKTVAEGPLEGPVLPAPVPAHSARIPRRLASALELVAEKVKETLAPVSALADPRPEEDLEPRPAEEEQRVELFVEQESSSAPPESRGLTKYVLELWLWMQFMIIIVVFLWAMARKGPKSVLGDAAQGRRRAAHTL